jgi:hypothetical protein
MSCYEPFAFCKGWIIIMDRPKWGIETKHKNEEIKNKRKHIIVSTIPYPDLSNSSLIIICNSSWYDTGTE